MYAQRNEDDFTLEYFEGKTDGRFLDIGAYDAKVFSQTRGLYERGWRGVMVEPAAGRFRELMKAYWNDPKIRLVNALITGSMSGFVPFWQNDDAISTMDAEHREKWAQASPTAETFCYCVPVEKLLGAFPGPYDFVNIDVEGAKNLEVFRAILALGCGASMFCVEYDAHLEEMTELASSKGYKQLTTTVENVLFVRK